jgi:gliding motility-associated lipoprotein GldH
MRTLFLFMVLVLVAVSCDPDKVFEENREIEGHTWKIGEVLHFKVPVEDTLSPQSVFINIRNYSDYPYSNLYLFIHVTSPAGDEVTDTLNFRLADDRGRWLGRGIGDLYFIRLPYKQDILFPYKGIYRFEIAQGMRTDLKGIRDVGLRVERIKAGDRGKK